MGVGQGWGLFALALLLCTGCGHGLRAGQEDVPPGLRATPGVFADMNPRWSHDGVRIVFLRATPDRQQQLYVVDGDLERPMALLEAELVSPDRPYAAGLCRYSSPDTLAWSPDDRQVAFERIEWFTFADGERLPGTGLWSLDISSGRVVPLALHPLRYSSLFYYYHFPQWSPDGRYLAFVGEGINGQRVIFARPLADGQAKSAVPRFDGYEDSDWPVWSPPVAGGNAPALVYRQGLLHTPRIVAETWRRLQPGRASGAQTGELWRVKALPAEVAAANRAIDRAVVPRFGHPAWSPDGKRLAFTLTPDPNDYSRYELWTINADGSGARRIAGGNGRGYLAPVWIGNRRLGALSPRGGRFDVVTVADDGSRLHTRGSIASADCDWSPDRSRIVYADPQADPADPDHPTTLRLFETGLRLQKASSPRRLPNSPPLPRKFEQKTLPAY